MYLCSKFTDSVAFISCKMFYKLSLNTSGLTFNFDLTDIIVLRSVPATQSFHAEIMVIFTELTKTTLCCYQNKQDSGVWGE